MAAGGGKTPPLPVLRKQCLRAILLFSETAMAGGARRRPYVYFRRDLDFQLHSQEDKMSLVRQLSYMIIAAL
jgi:hypothetical protein